MSGVFVLGIILTGLTAMNFFTFKRGETLWLNLDFRPEENPGMFKAVFGFQLLAWVMAAIVFIRELARYI